MTNDNRQPRSVRLLLVEDDPDFRDALVVRLQKRGWTIVAVPTAEEALAKLPGESFDAVISDIKLPTMDGIAFLRKVREQCDGLPVILLTGYASLETAKEAVRLQAFDYLLKPLENLNELLDPLEKAINSYQLLRQNTTLNTALGVKSGELEQSQTKYRSLFELAPDIIFTTDRQGIIREINHHVEEVTGGPAAMFLGQPMDALFSSLEDGEHRRKFQDVVAAVTQRGCVEVQLVTQGEGRRVLAELSMRPLPADNGGGIHGILRDITARKTLEEQLRQKVEELENWRRFTVGRELDMVDLKEEVNRLLERIGQTPKYQVPAGGIK